MGVCGAGEDPLAESHESNCTRGPLPRLSPRGEVWEGRAAWWQSREDGPLGGQLAALEGGEAALRARGPACVPNALAPNGGEALLGDGGGSPRRGEGEGWGARAGGTPALKDRRGSSDTSALPPGVVVRRKRVALHMRQGRPAERRGCQGATRPTLCPAAIPPDCSPACCSPHLSCAPAAPRGGEPLWSATRARRAQPC